MLKNPIKFNDAKNRPNKFNEFSNCLGFNGFCPMNTNLGMGLFIKEIRPKLFPKYNYNRRQKNNNKNFNKFDKKTENNLKKDISYELYQESSSHLSTTSEGGEHSPNNNQNNQSPQKDLSGKEKTKEKNIKKDEKNEIELIKKAFKDISDFFNSNQSNLIPLSCYYYCNINMNEQREYNLKAQLHI